MATDLRIPALRNDHKSSIISFFVEKYTKYANGNRNFWIVILLEKKSGSASFLRIPGSVLLASKLFLW